MSSRKQTQFAYPLFYEEGRHKASKFIHEHMQCIYVDTYAFILTHIRVCRGVRVTDSLILSQDRPRFCTQSLMSCRTSQIQENWDTSFTTIYLFKEPYLI